MKDRGKRWTTGFGMNIDTGEVWKIREGEPNQFAGHEYWHADGLHIGYHGFTESLERKDGKFRVYKI